MHIAPAQSQERSGRPVVLGGLVNHAEQRAGLGQGLLETLLVAFEGVEAAAQHERQLVLQHATGGPELAGVSQPAAQQARLAVGPAVAELGEVEDDQAQPTDVRRQVLDRVGVGKLHRGPGLQLLPLGERQRLEDGGAPLFAKQRHRLAP